MKILGKNVTLSIAVVASPEELELIGCGRTCTLITNVVTAPISTVGSGAWQEFKGLVNGWTASVDGFATLGENADIQTIRDLQFALEPVAMQFHESTSSGDVYYAGFVIITSVQTSGNYADAETYSLQLQGTGELLISN